jgi:maltooligosyltrehalose synthase
MRWQQVTGPIMAKGLEDTVLYIYNRLVSSNEVGGNPVPRIPTGSFIGAPGGPSPDALTG